MNLIKIVIHLKCKFSEFYDIKEYKKQASEKLVVTHCAINNQKITIDEKK